MPLGGENLEASPIQYYAVRKGANQAVAAARIGACVVLMGRVGDDRHGQQQLEALNQEGILTSLVGVDDKCMTGTAIILVEPQGQNRILLILGANHALQPAWLEFLFNLNCSRRWSNKLFIWQTSMGLRSCWILPQSVQYPKRGRVG